MTTARGEICSGRPGDYGQLTGKVWLCQNKGQWPIALQTSESQVISWLKQNPTGVAWEYSIVAVRQVKVLNPEPYLDAVDPVTAAKPEGAPR